MTSALVIGGAGNLGGHIIQLLLERGFKRVVSFDIVAYSGKVTVASKVGDITDAAALESAMADIDVVFHTASLIDIRPVPSLKMQHVNIDGTACVIKACKGANVRTLVYTSSFEVVGGVDQDDVRLPMNGLDESAPIPVQHCLPYAGTKAYAERLVLAADSAELRTCAIRPGYIMGANCVGLKIEMHRCMERKGYYVTAKPPAVISSVHPRNAALMHVMVAEQIVKPDVHGTAFFCRDFEDNVVSMTSASLASTPVKLVLLPWMVAYAIAVVMDRVERFLIWLYRLFGLKRVTPDSVVDAGALAMAWINMVVSDARGRKVLGYEPLVNKAECMHEAKEWCRRYWAELTTKRQSAI